MSSNNPVATALSKALADSYALYIKTQNYHWNVTGPNFRGLHLLFEEQYQELQEAIDVIAEHLRTLGSKTPASLHAFLKLSSIKDGDENSDEETMVRDLRDGQLTILKTWKDVSDIADKHDDPATSDLAVDRLRAHKKSNWMLSSVLNEEAPSDSKSKPDLKKAS